MVALRCGVPLAARGYDSTPWEEPARPRDRAAGPDPPVLYLATDLLDFGVKPLRVGEPWYGEFAWALHYQDTWTIAEHYEFWNAYLKRWPKRAGRGSKRDADAFAFALAARELAETRRELDAKPVFPIRRAAQVWGAELNRDLDQFAAGLTAAAWEAQRQQIAKTGKPIRGMSRDHYDLGDMRRRGVLRRANELLQTTPHHLRDEGLRLPRVCARDLGVIPSLAEILPFDDAERAAEASYIVRVLAAQVVNRMCEHIRSTHA
jgi:hypothetical protein